MPDNEYFHSAHSFLRWWLTRRFTTASFPLAPRSLATCPSRFCPRSWFAFSFGNIRCSTSCVIIHGHVGIGVSVACFESFEISLEIIDAPSTTGTCSSTLSKLTGATRFMNPQEVENLTLRNMEAKTNGIVELHSVDLRKEISL